MDGEKIVILGGGSPFVPSLIYVMLENKEVLEGATFVMPSYRIGGEKHMMFDFIIPTKHGICGDETAGLGGTFMAQCTIPETLKYCRLIENLHS